MITSHTDDLMDALSELRVLFPDWRMGQLIGNLVTAAGGLDAGSIWDMEDEKLLAAARRLIERNRSRSADHVDPCPINERPREDAIVSDEDNTLILSCPTCEQRLRVPTNRGDLVVHCPRCRHKWDWRASSEDRPEFGTGGPSPSARVAIPLIERVVAACRENPNLRVADIREAVRRIYSEQFGVQPSSSICLAIEQATVEELQAEEHGTLEGRIHDESANKPGLRGGTPYYVQEETSPWQENAIRDLEGE